MGSVAHHWLQEGIEKGIEKGRKTEKITLAKKILVKNKPLDEIIDFTGLTKKEIEKLK
ncbi:transposase [Rickettsia endosymbiont of Gonocerus acuteangulatus]|uniref:transposase n=1 Tax=Rickettsia endosymbiont of Gonocerus acuteangulatus TaxID=3066266 RepID=UPI003132DE3C